MDFLERTRLLIGENNIEKINNLKIGVFGLGGVGSYACEALARVGVGSFKLIDNDIVDKSNINRQIIALNSTIGKQKTDVMKNRILDINPNCKVEIFNKFYLNKNDVDISDCDYIIDAIDTITGKLEIIEACKEENIKIISSMGCGNRTDPSKLKIDDIYNTTYDPLCKIMRKELRKRKIEDLQVVYSTEKPIKLEINQYDRKIIGSISYVPSVAGLLIASAIINSFIHNERKD